jgi:hypothetical protein
MEGKTTGMEDDIWGLGGGVRAAACNVQCNESSKSRHALRVYPEAERMEGREADILPCILVLSAMRRGLQALSSNDIH